MAISNGVNNYTGEYGIHRAYAIINSIKAQATGDTSLTAVDASTFVSVGQELLQLGADPIFHAIAQILERTIFSVRPYEPKFRALEADSSRFGAVTRKLNIADSDFDSATEFDLTDGQAVDHYKVKKADIIQFNFYGSNAFQLQAPSWFRDQLDVAFSGPDQLEQFWGMVTQNAYDIISQAKESMARATIANLINGLVAAKAANVKGATVINLLQEYYDETGVELTPTTYAAPTNFVNFARWANGYFNQTAKMLSERSTVYHINKTDHEISRHTPSDRLKALMYSPFIEKVKSEVATVNFNDTFFNLPGYETVNYWQSIESPDKIKSDPCYLKNDGTIDKGATTETAHVMGVMMDEDAAGYTVCNEWVGVTPMNAKGGYVNTFYNFRIKYWNDFTENAVVFVLDNVTTEESKKK